MWAPNLLFAQCAMQPRYAPANEISLVKLSCMSCGKKQIADSAVTQALKLMHKQRVFSGKNILLFC